MAAGRAGGVDGGVFTETASSDSRRTGAVGHRWKHHGEGYVVVLDGWIPGVRSWSANRENSGWTEFVRDCDLHVQFMFIGDESDGSMSRPKTRDQPVSSRSRPSRDSGPVESGRQAGG